MTRILKAYSAGAEGQPFARRLLLFGAFTAALALFQFPYWPWVVFYVFLLSGFEGGRISALSRLNILFWLVTGSLISITRPETGGLAEAADLSFAVYLFAIAMFAGVYFVLSRLHSGVAKHRSPVISLCLAFIALLFVAKLFPEGPIRLTFVALLFIISKTFWMTGYQLSEASLLRGKPFLEHFGTLSSPWQATFTNTSIIRGYSDYTNHNAETPAELWRTRVSGLRLIGVAILWKALANLWKEFFFADTAYLIRPAWKFYVTYLGGPFDPATYSADNANWNFVLAYALHFTFLYTAYNHALVGIARMCGFGIMRAVYKPYLSTSFSNFLARYYFYYVAILQRFFFYPLWETLSFIKQKEARILIVFVLTIVFAGYITSAERHIASAIEMDWWTYITLTTRRLPYFLTLGVIAGLAAILPGIPGQKTSTPKRLAMSAFYYTLYSLCFSLQAGPPDAGFMERYKSLLALFSLHL